MIKQPVEGVDGQPRHQALAQRLDVVAIGFALHGRALAKPASGRHAGEGHGQAVGVVGTHLEQPLDHAEPISDGPPHAADIVAAHGIAHHQRRRGALALGGIEQTQPGDTVQFKGGGWTTTLMQREFLTHSARACLRMPTIWKGG
ncbi:hypothetical protein SDC9_155368 [bioreactor metagenome]|uniref:Uncharacterized protein n=1 Tax=bioreactor metagenome TaxID=1076179 RepID=A0A645F1C9_9ZZZZ